MPGEIDDFKLLEAIGSAVDQATPPDVREATAPAGDDQSTTHDDGKADSDDADTGKKADDSAKGDDGKGADQDAPDPEADRGDGRNALGHFVKKQGETDAQLAARRAADPDKGKPPAGDKGAAKPEIDPKTGQPKAPAKPAKVDHVNDPIPAELKGKTRERMEGLVNTAKTLTTERDAARKAVKEFDDAIKATGADPETFGRHMDVLAAMLSDDPAQQREAVKLLRHAADRLAQELGDTPSGKDPLEGHQDLIDKVEDGDVTKELAIELAEARNRKKAEDARNTKKGEQSQAQREQSEAVDAARAELNTYGAQLAKDDKLFAVKAKILLPAVQAMAASTHPSKWLEAYKKMYANLKLAPTSVAPADNRQRVPEGTGNRQPQRPKQGAGGGGRPAPTSIEQAIDFGLDNERAARGR